jgi:hypothetical protein
VTVLSSLVSARSQDVFSYILPSHLNKKIISLSKFLLLFLLKILKILKIPPSQTNPNLQTENAKNVVMNMGILDVPIKENVPGVVEMGIKKKFVTKKEMERQKFYFLMYKTMDLKFVQIYFYSKKITPKGISLNPTHRQRWIVDVLRVTKTY